MKIGRIIVGALLWIVVIGLAFWLYGIIQDPVEFEKEYDKRHAATTSRMYDIKAAQGFYLKAKGKYASNFDELINSVKNDMITEIVINGNPDDTSVVATYDTLRYLIKDEINFEGTPVADSLRYVPFTGGETFDLQADVIKLQRVEVPVYEVFVPKSRYLINLKDEYIALKEDLRLGSVTQATEKASWE